MQREHTTFDEDATVRLLSELEEDKELTSEQVETVCFFFFLSFFFVFFSLSEVR